MPNWNDISDEIKETGSTYDVIRRKYLKKLYEYTKRNVIVYYSGWLQKPGFPPGEISINDDDKTGFMSTVNNLDRSKGLDLFLHTPGGAVAATESLVDYLRKLFGVNIRAIVPHLAMSAGTMIACASKSIVMGSQSSLGPIDPILNGLPAHGVIEEFQQAFDETQEDPGKIPLWQPIIARYNPTLIGECQKAIKWSDTLVTQWLKSGMFKGARNVPAKVKKIKKELGDHSLTLSHSRHLDIKQCKSMGLKIETLEDDSKLQDLVLSVHHSFIHTFMGTNAYKIIENHEGVAYVKQANMSPQTQ